MKIAITIIFLIIAVVLTCIVLKQEGKENGLTSAISGQQDSYWARNKKHSKEAVIQRVTTILAVLFFVIAILLSSKWM